MAHAQECDSCGALFKPVKGTVSLEYSICEGNNTYVGYQADDHDPHFSLCLRCGASFLAFIKHDGDRGDGTRGAALPSPSRGDGT